ncbi:glucosamine 6-phosphate synthetase [Alcaligenes endophyticus]|uniref:Glucosamine 6-phosphate synthetase n=1 Tax=Alcaligenes endophyticus TaxID=1929088 RepID=A0ABT8EFT8_9BURK|nr:glucosamine 6-phosphate synthetase [Alcaligenes endophyticus]MCX5590187.1 glucosamine 6-phosphate synthetase [Alcaligenes endophyticus]MDN4120150.1 glucosamine 6-phosphate synthetase [Alcaligenes endophyticus]
MSALLLRFYYSAKKVDDIWAESSRQLVSRGKNSSALLQANSLSLLHLLKRKSSLGLLSSQVDTSNRLLIAYAGLNNNLEQESTPLVKDDLLLFADGLLLNRPLKPDEFRVSTATNIDLFLDWIAQSVRDGLPLKDAAEAALANVKGNINALLLAPKEGKVLALSNHGSLFYHQDDELLLVASERSWLSGYAAQAVQLFGVHEFNLASATATYKLNITQDFTADTRPLPLFPWQDVLQYKIHHLKRCSRCILPETMPYIRFDVAGVCNYCHTYKKRNQAKNPQRLHELVAPYRRNGDYDCIVPFSGGRDSCFGLHLIVNELKLKPITYTYDWGMVTDVGRRNIALMCGALGVENIVVADDIQKKRRNIAMNFAAWLKHPHLGMLNILTAGDKHFFRYVNKVKEDTGISLNLWGVNPLEVTHFKTGFLGIEPDFERQRVYASGKMGQLRYQSKRFYQMLKSPGYFNSSLWDTWSGEYYRSAAKKADYFHIFDYWQWKEEEINSLLAEYNWELATDTPTTWRIGDGTAGIYNYIYYTLAGFTEHDTFRSNQVREGELTREQALRLVEKENAPCHDNIRWYLASIGFDFQTTIQKINTIPRLHEGLY